MVCRLVRDADLRAMAADAELATRAASLWASPNGPHGLRDRRAPCSPDEYLDLDKSWAGVSWLLTGDVDSDEPWPAAGAVLGGVRLGDEDDMILGLTSEQVREVSTYLDAHLFIGLWNGLTSESLEELMYYEGSWPRDAVAEYRAYLRDGFAELLTCQDPSRPSMCRDPGPRDHPVLGEELPGYALGGGSRGTRRVLDRLLGPESTVLL
jgi:Domain of unknown function (DUF1877)